jgi:hypothetical protein
MHNTSTTRRYCREGKHRPDGTTVANRVSQLVWVNLLTLVVASSNDLSETRGGADHPATSRPCTVLKLALSRHLS